MLYSPIASSYSGDCNQTRLAYSPIKLLNTQQASIFGVSNGVTTLSKPSISGFTMVRNADQLYYPVKESISSILPLVDEFIVTLGESSPGDKTREIIESIGSPKIRIIERVWDEALFVESKILRHETNAALAECKGDWCIYIQADEVLLEDGIGIIQKAIEKYHTAQEVDGFLLNYQHFWGDYEHHLPFHGWYKQEIRIIRNHRSIQSIKDAQSFRYGSDDKIPCMALPATMFHYGWVRPPEKMKTKKRVHDGLHWGKKKANEHYDKESTLFDYGDMSKIPKFKGTHPAVMQEWMSKLDWQHQLRTGGGKPDRILQKHEKPKYRILSAIERNILGGRRLFDYSNWILKGKFRP